MQIIANSNYYSLVDFIKGNKIFGLEYVKAKGGNPFGSEEFLFYLELSDVTFILRIFAYLNAENVLLPGASLDFLPLNEDYRRLKEHKVLGIADDVLESLIDDEIKTISVDSRKLNDQVESPILHSLGVGFGFKNERVCDMGFSGYINRETGLPAISWYWNG